MRRPCLLLVATSLITLVACSDKTETRTARADADGKTKISVEIDGDETSSPGKFELKLPGGIDAKVDLPQGLGDESRFDINGVGLFPGARVRSVDIDAANAQTTRTATVKIGFNAPGDAAAVTDWYQQQFDAKNVRVARSGETLAGSTGEGKPFTLALEPAGAGASKGLLTITDTKES